MALKLKFVFLIIISSTSITSKAHSPNPRQVEGSWRFVEVLYQGERRPPFSDDLILSFEFSNQGDSRLHWTRTGEIGFCERKAHYSFDGEYLTQEIYWVNPKNRVDCSSDPDMQMGKTSITPAVIQGEELHTQLELSGESLYYIWKRTNKVFKYLDI